jgi:hypothetical protein
MAVAALSLTIADDVWTLGPAPPRAGGPRPDSTGR